MLYILCYIVAVGDVRILTGRTSNISDFRVFCRSFFASEKETETMDASLRAAAFMGEFIHLVGFTSFNVCH